MWHCVKCCPRQQETVLWRGYSVTVFQVSYAGNIVLDVVMVRGNENFKVWGLVGEEYIIEAAGLGKD